MNGRAATAIAIVAAMRLYTLHADTERPAWRRPLSELTMTVGDWQGSDAGPFEDDVLKALGVDDYVNRMYVANGAAPVALYVGYYASQRQGDTIHSPQNCLPGAGWQPIASRTISVSGPAATTVTANQFIVQKGLDREVVVYWYEGRGHVEANEYANKLWLMLDAARLHRTDGGLVRVITPVLADTAHAATDASRFAALLLPYLSRYLP